MPVKSLSQKRFMGIVESIKKGKTPASYSPAAAKAARTMKLKSIRHFSSTKEAGLSEKTRKKARFSFPGLAEEIRKRRKSTDEQIRKMFPESKKKKKTNGLY